MHSLINQPEHIACPCDRAPTYTDTTLSSPRFCAVLKGSVGLYLPEAANTSQLAALFSDWPFTFLISNPFGLHP